MPTKKTTRAKTKVNASKTNTKASPNRKAATPLNRVRKICSALSEATEKTAWGAPTFRVKSKMFAMFMDNHHGDGRVALWLKAEPGDQETLVAADPEVFFVPPYQGPFGWIGVRLDRNLPWRDVEELLREAYRAAAPKMVVHAPEARTKRK